MLTLCDWLNKYSYFCLQLWHLLLILSIDVASKQNVSLITIKEDGNIRENKKRLYITSKTEHSSLKGACHAGGEVF